MSTWLDFRITIRSARCGGLGSFAAEAIRQGARLIQQDGYIIPNIRLTDPAYRPFADHCFQIARHFCISPLALDAGRLDGVFQVNHSCEPNAGFRSSHTLVAMRDIAAGEEIVYDYAMTDMDVEDLACAEMRCLCGTPSCRGVITGNDWRRPDLQRKYAGFFSPYLQQEIDRQFKAIAAHPY